ncbi:helix-turn-helix transcriptional regulator [uncultured Oscillibacter sp.]|uniref:helix-turn-helix domain-containing protein n=1 Tax=uncultured Oscillibacter sp. TaxID=876091 RepID=UPI002633FEF6|nr:helix-turn-helix transcriptional regulator [uncultured Oscillibacter sp.]
MNNRIAQVITALGIKKIEFAKKIGISSPFVSELCSGAKKASDRTITDICREFNVNETWLRTGEGEMFAQESSFDLEEYIKRRGVTELEIQILKAYFDLDSGLREELLQHFKGRLSAEQKKPTPVSEDGLEDYVREHKKNLNAWQEQQIMDMMKTMIASQKQPLSASGQESTDEKAPKTESPDPA